MSTSWQTSSTPLILVTIFFSETMSGAVESLTTASGIDNSIETRERSLASILKEKGENEESLVQAIVALGEGKIAKESCVCA